MTPWYAFNATHWVVSITRWRASVASRSTEGDATRRDRRRRTRARARRDRRRRPRVGARSLVSSVVPSGTEEEEDVEDVDKG